MKRIIWFVLCALCAIQGRAAAEGISEAQFQALQAQVQQLTQTVSDLTVQVQTQSRELQTLRGQAAPAQQGRPAIAPTAAVSGPRGIQGRWNPDIGLVGDVVFMADSPKEDAEGADRISIRSLEIVFGSEVDPYSRFDATLGISDYEGMEIEEAFLTRRALPFDLEARIGRFFPKIGKAIPVHRDALDTVDEPMVIERYFGHHGYHKSGVDLSRSIDLPWAAQHRVTLGVLEGGNGEGGTLFGETRRMPTLYSSLKNDLHLSQDIDLEIGLSQLAGSRDDDEAFEVSVYGLDGTLIWRYAEARHLKLQTEAYSVHRDESFYPLEDAVTGTFTEQDLDDARHLWGAYALLDLRFHPQWAAGLRFDDVQPIEAGEDPASSGSTERGYTGYLTFHQNEFARWRLQFSHIDRIDGKDDDRVFLQGTFIIGEHAHRDHHQGHQNEHAHDSHGLLE